MGYLIGITVRLIMLFKNYVQDTGKSQTTSSLVGQQQSNLFDHYNDLMKTNTQDYNDYMNLVKANPFFYR